MMQQRSYNPIYPSTTSVDWAQFRGLMFSDLPDLLITPSEVNPFAKNIDGCVCINPGTLCKGTSGGTYASITVDPYVVQNAGADPSEKHSNRAADRVRVDIIHI